MNDDPARLREDPSSPEGLRALMASATPPPRIGAATRAASAAAVATLAGGGAAAASAAGAAGAGGSKLWLVFGGLAVSGLVAGGIVIGSVPSQSPERPAPAPVVAAAERATPAPTHASPATPEVAELPPPTEAPTEAPPPEPVVAPTEARLASRARRAETIEEPGPGGLVAEAALLEEARGLLAADPARALAATERHLRRHPRPQLAAEREFIAIDALRRLGRGALARRRAQRLIDRAPSGIYADRARAILRDLPE